ncbi:MAG: histidine kinase [Opitutaceae bacterium]
MPAIFQAHNQATLLRLGVFGGWLLFTLMVIAISWGGALVRGRPAELSGLIVWNLGWLLWAGVTFLVARLARRFPLERPRLARGIALHSVLGVAVGVSMLILEFLFAHALQAVWAGAPRANAFLGFIVYKFHVYFLVYWMVLGATRAYDYYAKFRESTLLASQLEAQLAQAQLHALKTQLHPHFLFNTHHAIVSLMLKQENATAIKMLTRLSDLLRLTLRHSDRQMSSLQEELDALELYLGIQRERFRDRLEIRYEIDPATLAAEVPSLLLQPLVENALKHGIDTLPGQGVLRVRAATEDSRLVLTVADNGPGFPIGFDPATAAGIGLKNTRARLARLYGADHTLEFLSASPPGAEVRLTMPLRVSPPSTDAAHE